MTVGERTAGVSIVIPTRGTRLQHWPDIYSAILDQQFPQAEVILVGQLPSQFRIPFGCYYIPEPEAVEQGFVTRLMNRGCAEARHELLVMIHDDVALHERFWERLRVNDGQWDMLAPKYASGFPNSYTGMGCRWTMLGPKGHRPLRDDEPWDPYSYMCGNVMIMWRQTWEQHPWDPDNNFVANYGTHRAFDVQYGHEANAKGLVTAYDPTVMVHCLEP